MTEKEPSHWDARYAQTDQLWSGRANQAVIDGVSRLTPGHALDLGCGEGGDAIWLAQHGWTVVGVDLSPIAIARAQAAAHRLGLPLNATRFIAGDLTTWQPDDGYYDLVTASFLHLPDLYAPDGIIHKVIQRLREGGHLLAVSHAEPPPWSDHGHVHPENTLFDPQDQFEALNLDPVQWRVRLAEVRSRWIIGPDGQQNQLKDSVLLIERLHS